MRWATPENAVENEFDMVTYYARCLVPPAYQGWEVVFVGKGAVTVVFLYVYTAVSRLYLSRNCLICQFVIR